MDKQTTKGSISNALAGLEADDKLGTNGIDIHERKGLGIYPELLETYAAAARTARQRHRPQLIHVTELTQPNGHSTSGSHERYKDKERLAWEEKRDCITKFRLLPDRARYSDPRSNWTNWIKKPRKK